MSGIFAGLLAASAIARVFVEDVFSTYLYTGNGSTQTITNGIDLAGKGGLVWIKQRGGPDNHQLRDTERGGAWLASSSSIAAQASSTTDGTITSYNSNGFTLGTSGGNQTPNGNGTTQVSWTFREAPNFFDIVTYTGNGANRNIAHNLGVAPGMMLVKRTSSNADWQIYHQSLGSNQVIDFSTAAATTFAPWNSTTPTATDFRISTSSTVNAFGETYVAYLFAHDPSADGLIQCGSYTGNGSATGPVITLGWEPQWIMVKYADPPGYSGNNWQIIDNMRGLPVGSADATLQANLSDAETSVDYISPTATGFQVVSTSSQVNTSASTYIYMAIRRGPMRTPTLGTSVFYPQTVAQTDTPDSSGVPFPPDLVNTFSRNGTDRTSAYDNFLFVDRLRSLGVPNNTYSGGTAGRALVSSSTGAELSASAGYVQLKADSQNITRGPGWNNTLYGNMIYYFFRRAPSFMDVVCYTGTSNFPQSYNHNLGVAPEMIIVKCRNSTTDGDASFPARWWVGVKGPQPSGANSGYVFSPGLDTTNAVLANDTWGSSVQTATSFVPWYVTLRSGVEGITGQVVGKLYVAYLFASCPGVSKVGTYTGNGSSQTINCAFTTGARFVLIKRTDSTGDWYVWDSARGIVAGNDPYLALNSTAAEVTSDDSVDTDSTGFVVNQVAASNINVNAATYIFLAIA